MQRKPDPPMGASFQSNWARQYLYFLVARVTSLRPIVWLHQRTAASADITR
jgi:hypothetical protein